MTTALMEHAVSETNEAPKRGPYRKTKVNPIVARFETGFTERDAAKLIEAAEEAGIKPAAFIRDAVLKEIKRFERRKA